MNYQFENPIRLIELFAGYGSQALALRYLGIPFEHHFVCEFDKYAIQSYNDIHGTDFDVSDIRDVHADDLGIVDTDNYKYLLTYSFPCTDLSLAGRRAGMERGSGTSSSLLWEVERLLNECNELPQYLLMENVPQVISKDNLHNFGQWTAFLSKLGYENHYKLLNAKDYGVPQHRERCFMVSILRSEHKGFVFPKSIPLEIRLKDVLEDNVDEKYYLTSEKAQKLIYELYEKGDLHPGTVDLCLNKPKYIDVANCITAKDRSIVNFESYGVGVLELGYAENGTGKHQSNTVYGTNGVAPTLNATDYKDSIKVVVKHETCQRTSNGTGYIKIKNNTKQGFDVAKPGDGIDISNRMECHRGTVQNGMVGTIKRTQDIGVVCDDYRIRKLTPKERFRLMGVKDEDYDKLTVSKTHKIKQAGNSIVVDVLMAIFENMFLKKCKSNRLF